MAAVARQSGAGAGAAAAAVQFTIKDSSNSKDTAALSSSYLPLSWTSAAAAAHALPPAMPSSSSPIASDDSSSYSLSSLSSQGSGSSCRSSNISLDDIDTDELPTPGDVPQDKDKNAAKDRAREAILNSAASAIANLNRKRRVVWDLRHRASCASSPKHRFHPYSNTTRLPLPQQSGKDDISTASSSSPSSRRASLRHRRTSSAIRAGLSSSSASTAPTTTTTTFAPPRSILKSLRNSRVSQYGLLSHSSPGKRALHASPGGGTSSSVSVSGRFSSSSSAYHLLSPSASPRRRSTASFTPTRSPGRSPRIPSLFFSAVTGSAKNNSNKTKSPSLAEITRANGGGRAHTVAFPDLRALTTAPSTATATAIAAGSQDSHSNVTADEAGAAGTPMMMSLEGSTSATTTARAHKGDQPHSDQPAADGSSTGIANGSAQAEGARSMDISGRSARSGNSNKGTTSAGGLVGLGLGQPFEDAGSKSARQQLPETQETADDPRLQIISACHTLRHSLAAPIWHDPTKASGESSAGGSNGNSHFAEEEDDCFDSQPFDFPPRNLEQVLPEETGSSPQPQAGMASSSSTSRKAPAVHLREVEAAYATIFQYAQVYIQMWNAMAQEHGVACSSERPGTWEGHGESRSAVEALKEDDADHEFATLAPSVIKCIYRDIHRSLNPVPVPTATATAARPQDNIDNKSAADEASTSNAPGVTANVPPQSKISTTLEESREAKNTLLHRTGLLSPANAVDANASDANGDGSDDDPPTSSPLVFPAVDSPDAAAAAAAAASQSAAAGAIGGKVAEKPKRMGRSTAEMRRRRNELHVVEAALQALGTLLACERFSRHFEDQDILVTLTQASLLPHSNMFKGPKHRDLLSSFNWIISNQTLIRPLYLHATLSGSRRLLHGHYLRDIVSGVIASINASTKNGEKARRVLSEGFRALRTLILCYPSYVLNVLTTTPNLGKIAFFAKYLCSPTKPLRDNAALLLASIALGMTAGWDDTSADSAMKKYKMQEMISIELFRYWALDPVEIDELSRHLNVALDSKLASDYNYVRLVVNILPIILGRRFRKMERKGPHMWLSKVVELKRRGDATTPISSHAAALHLMTFVHVTHSWSAASKEAASKALLQDNDAPADRANEEIWGLGDKALRVVAQNVEHVAAKQWTKETYSIPENASEINAAVALITSLIYTFTGLAYTIQWSPSVIASTMSLEDRLTYANPSLQRDLTRIWTVLISKHLPKLFSNEIFKIHNTGWQILHALFRQGEVHPEEDSTLTNWSADRIVSIRMLGGCTSQASQALEPIEPVISEGVSPSEIPAMQIAWLIDHRVDAMSLLDTAFSGFAKQLWGACLAELDCQDWLKNQDGYPLMPAALSNCVRSFLITLRAGFATDDSQTKPSQALLSILNQLSTFLISMLEHLMQPTSVPSSLPPQMLSPEGTSFSTAQHFLGLLELAFGRLWLTSETENVSSAGLFQRWAINAAQNAPLNDAQTCSAYATLLESVYECDEAAFSPRVLSLLSQRVHQLQTCDADSAPAARTLWNTSARLLDRRLQRARQGQDKRASDLNQFKDVTLRFLKLAPTVEVEERDVFESILAMHSGGIASRAWTTLQGIADHVAAQGIDAEAFFGWSLLPLMRRLPDLHDQQDFIANVTKVVALAATIAHSSLWSLPDMADALLAGIRRTPERQFAEVLSSVHSILLTLCEASGLPIHTKVVLFKALLEAVEGAYSVDGGRPELAHLSAILVRCPDDCQDMLADVWNITFGNGHETLALERDLQDLFAKMREQGLIVRLPGSWNEPSDSLDEPEMLGVEIADSETTSALQDPADAAKTASTEVVEETQTQVIQSQPTVEEVAEVTEDQELALPIQEDSVPAATTRVEDDDLSSALTRNNVQMPRMSLTEEAGKQVAPIESAAPLSDVGAEEDESISAIPETETNVHRKAAPSTQLPPMSQITDISNVMATHIENASAVESLDTTLVPRPDVTISNGDEESFRSMVPETQEPVPGKEAQAVETVQDEERGAIAAKVVNETVVETLDEVAEAADEQHPDESHADWVPETQVLKDVGHGSGPTAQTLEVVAEAATSLNITHIEETQPTRLSATHTASEAESISLPFPREPSLELPEPAPRQSHRPSPRMSVSPASGPSGEMHLNTVPIVNKAAGPTQAIKPSLASTVETEEIAETQLAEDTSSRKAAAVSRQASFSSVASGSSNNGSRKARRTGQIVEVVIPYRPWLSRSTSCLQNVPTRGDGQSQSPFSHTASNPVQKQDKISEPSKTERKRVRDDDHPVSANVPTERPSDKKQKRDATTAETASKRPAASGRARKDVPTPFVVSKAVSKHVPARQQKAVIAPSIERRLKGTTSLPTIIHKRPTEPVYADDVFSDDGHSEDDANDDLSSSEEEIYVASSPSVARHIRNISDSVELSKKAKRSRSTSSQGDDDEDYTPESEDERVRDHRRDHRSRRTSSSPTVAASQRKRAYSQSQSRNEARNNARGDSTTTSRRDRHRHLAGTDAEAYDVDVRREKQSKKKRYDGRRAKEQSPSVTSSSRLTTSTAQTGRELARILAEGRDSEIEAVLEDLDEEQMKYLHNRLEGRLRRVYGVKPLKVKRHSS